MTTMNYEPLKHAVCDVRHVFRGIAAAHVRLPIAADARAAPILQLKVPLMCAVRDSRMVQRYLMQDLHD